MLKVTYNQFKNRYINGDVNTIDTLEDWKSFIYLQYLEAENRKGSEFINELFSKPTEFRRYVMGIIWNQILSKKSYFYKLYRKNGFSSNLKVDTKEIVCVNDHINQFKIDMEKVEILMLKKSNNVLDISWNLILFSMYFIERKTYKEIAEYVECDIQIIKRNIKSTVKYLKNNIDECF